MFVSHWYTSILVFLTYYSGTIELVSYLLLYTVVVVITAGIVYNVHWYWELCQVGLEIIFVER